MSATAIAPKLTDQLEQESLMPKLPERAMGPLNEEPVSIRPPFEQRPPAAPFDPDAKRRRASIRADRIAAISEALAGVELGEYDRKMIEWMAGWDEPTIGTWVSLLYRTRRAGEAR